LPAALATGVSIAAYTIVDGFGVRVVVERGALEVHDGVGPHRPAAPDTP